MNKTEMSVGKQIKYQYTICGALYIACGIFYFFDNIPSKILFVICPICYLFTFFKPFFSLKEKEDEMSEQHLSSAKAHTLTISQILLSFIIMLLLFFSLCPISNTITINWKKLAIPFLFILIGFNELLTGILFKKFEEE